jgi:hypothetical protein
LLTNISGQPIGAIVKAVIWDLPVVPKRRQGITTSRCIITQKSAILNAAIVWPKLILSELKEYPDARDILKFFHSLMLRNRLRFGECICLHCQIRGKGEPTLVGSLGDNWSVSLDTELDISRVYVLSSFRLKQKTQPVFDTSVF